jgi:hypothetical protein
MTRNVKEHDMKFEIIGADGKVHMYTEYRKCIPSDEQLLRMALKGYTFKLDGKRWKIGQEIGGEKRERKTRSR